MYSCLYLAETVILNRKMFCVYGPCAPGIRQAYIFTKARSREGQFRRLLCSALLYPINQQSLRRVVITITLHLRYLISIWALKLDWPGILTTPQRTVINVATQRASPISKLSQIRPISTNQITKLYHIGLWKEAAIDYVAWRDAIRWTRHVCNFKRRIFFFFFFLH